ncbi:amidohydrolase [Amycolatopsis jejuensis]|uniref:amidohydrolase n=1 Tax=Amycolatopsis jejuensis TaxID=330084 RepID=UPI000527C05F|nr:amidohydrolase [Amycolatopsis jejuensis]
MRLDLVVGNARIRTMDPAYPLAERVGVMHGRIVGLDRDLDGVSAAEVVDARGRVVVPGFVDAHSHLAWAGLAAGAVDLTGAATIDQALGVIEAAAAQTDGWVDVIGYDQRPFGRHLTREDLDRAAPGRKVYVIHTSGHAHLVSTAVLDELPEPPRGPGVVLEDGRPTGLFLEAATEIVNALRTPYPLETLQKAIARAAETCAAQGITSVTEAGLGGGLTARSPIEALAYQNADLPIRTQLMVSLDALQATQAHPADGVTRALPLGLRSGFGNGRLSLGAAKTWLDGGMMARTAALTEPYLGSDTCGDLADVEEITEAACAAHAAGWQLALHAIGDRAIDAALEIVTTAQRRHPRPDPRHRIEHCGLVRPDQLPKLAEAQVTAVLQPTFLHAFGDDYAAVMGPDRAPWMYRGRSLLDHGIPIAGSSDRPVADGAPLRAMQFMVERRSGSGRLIGPQETITVAEALHAYTMGAARACRTQHQVGSITPGKYADFTVLDADPFEVPTAELAAVPVTATVVGGQLVHGTWSTR